jgi:hypothetical protein
VVICWELRDMFSIRALVAAGVLSTSALPLEASRMILSIGNSPS